VGQKDVIPSFTEEHGANTNLAGLDLHAVLKLGAALERMEFLALNHNDFHRVGHQDLERWLSSRLEIPIHRRILDICPVAEEWQVEMPYAWKPSSGRSHASG